MRKIILGIVAFATVVTTLFAGTPSVNEKIFVVERETSSVAIINQGLTKSRMENMHNMNHGIIKFDGKDAYLISRDGFVVHFDPESEKVLHEYKTSKSAIGFVIGENYVAVANYDDKSVDILTRDLKPIDKIKTGSKNVGIKIYRDMIIFAQMDSDKVTILKNETKGKGLPKFKIFKEFKVGAMPFDAMIKDNTYIVGFFLSKSFGVIDLDTMKFREIAVTAKDNKPVLKVPHFGFWSLSEDKTFIPAVGSSAVMVYDPNFKFIKNIEVQGLPVFTALSPDKKYLAVTFSGKDFPTIQIVDTKTLKIIHTFKFNGKVLHVRWSNIDDYLYVSVNDSKQVTIIDSKKVTYKGQLNVINTKEWFLEREIFQLKSPSGIFIYEQK
jgi:protein NirF